MKDNGAGFSHCQRMEYKYAKEENKHESCGDYLELEVLKLQGFNKYKHRCEYLYMYVSTYIYSLALR